MTTRSPLLPPPLEALVVPGTTLLAVLLATVGVLAVPTIGSRAQAAPAPIAADAVAPTAAPSPTTTALRARPAGAVRRRRSSTALSTTTSSASTTSTTVADPEPPAFSPPLAGEYEYHASLNGTAEDVVLQARPLDDAGWEEERRFGGETQTRDLSLDPSGVSVLQTADAAGACRLQPPFADLRLPVAVGTTWHSTATCRRDDATTVTTDEDVRVSGRASTAVGRQRTEVWVLERHTVVTAAREGASAVAELQRTDLLSPSLGLVVYETGRSQAPDRTGTVQESRWTLELVSPEPS